MGAAIRDQAKVVYASLRDAPRGRSYEELEADCWLSRSELLASIMWMREHGVDVVVARGRMPGDPSKVVLGKLLPAAWDGLI